MGAGGGGVDEGGDGELGDEPPQAQMRRMAGNATDIRRMVTV
jgi:hypothetical protein